MAKSEELVKDIVQKLTDIYDLKNSRVDVVDKGDYDLIVLNNKEYTIYPSNDKDVDDIVSYITADQNLQPKTVSKVEEGMQIKEDDDDITPPTISEDYPSLLVALESEKDAEITYKSLIEIEKSADKPNQQVIDLLEKILKDELEHIALLSALSANKNSEYVAEDSQEQFDDYIDATQNGEVAEGLDSKDIPKRFGNKQTIDIINGKLFKYKHDDNKDHIFDTVDDELKEISKCDPYCIANNVVTDDDGSQYAEVNFDIPENSDIDLPYSGEYIVPVDELTAVNVASSEGYNQQSDNDNLKTFNVHISDDVWYDNVVAEDKDSAIDIASEWYDERKPKIEIEEV